MSIVKRHIAPMTGADNVFPFAEVHDHWSSGPPVTHLFVCVVTVFMELQHCYNNLNK